MSCWGIPRFLGNGAGGGGGGGGWTPASAASGLIWLLGDDYSATTGTATDQIGAGHNGTQSSSGARPTVGTSIGNTIKSNGSQWLDLPNLGGAGALTIGLRYKLTSVPSGAFVTLVSLYDGSAYGSQITIGSGVGGYQNINLYFGTSALGAGVGFSPTMDTATHEILAIYAGGGPSTVSKYTLYFDGVLQTLTTSGNLQGPSNWVGDGGQGALLTLAQDGSVNTASAEIRTMFALGQAVSGSDLSGALTYLASA